MDLVIYHAHCADGFTAAYVARLLYPDAEFIAAHYGDFPPDVTARDVLIVDFSYKRETLLRMEEQAHSLRVIDHHRTARADLYGLPFCDFDMDRSGAGLAWDLLHGGKRPLLVNYVEDRDLWRWKLTASRSVNAYISVQERTFERWASLSAEVEHRLANVMTKGDVALRVTEQYVETQRDRARMIELAGHKVPCVNTTFATSEIVGALAEGHPFAVGWFEREDGKFVYSLRSRGEGGADVSEIAKYFGGGGHRNAAGFTCDEPIHRRRS